MKAPQHIQTMPWTPRVSRLPSRKAPNSRPSSSLKESHPSSSKGVLSFVFEKGVPSSSL
ncbi:Hypothetical protein FKW44_000142 [Caligus rogercresseyi]|uniref:Uncharacterized protein n=1 Tax=Caligus rogercresseyi TaxID=217165 RepID=A0A7T8KGY0_CALRO|nr:Hypothetical protein FKW44_000142 [Caligus rogercresseyi]